MHYWYIAVKLGLGYQFPNADLNPTSDVSLVPNVCITIHVYSSEIRDAGTGTLATTLN